MPPYTKQHLHTGSLLPSLRWRVEAVDLHLTAPTLRPSSKPHLSPHAPPKHTSAPRGRFTCRNQFPGRRTFSMAQRRQPRQYERSLAGTLSRRRWSLLDRPLSQRPRQPLPLLALRRQRVLGTEGLQSPLGKRAGTTCRSLLAPAHAMGRSSSPFVSGRARLA